ncbi:MAG: hypothetical protein GY849_03665 [Deltaproteobacteria bacterium]|nr:hypothetical protein [Deltaproteobacteria bacterium]
MTKKYQPRERYQPLSGLAGSMGKGLVQSELEWRLKGRRLQDALPIPKEMEDLIQFKDEEGIPLEFMKTTEEIFETGYPLTEMDISPQANRGAGPENRNRVVPTAMLMTPALSAKYDYTWREASRFQADIVPTPTPMAVEKRVREMIRKKK